MNTELYPTVRAVCRLNRRMVAFLSVVISRVSVSCKLIGDRISEGLPEALWRKGSCGRGGYAEMRRSWELCEKRRGFGLSREALGGLSGLRSAGILRAESLGGYILL
jgi:hypothetical protein